MILYRILALLRHCVLAGGYVYGCNDLYLIFEFLLYVYLEQVMINFDKVSSLRAK